MPDPHEGVAADGTICTGARRDRVPPLFDPVVCEASGLVDGAAASLYVYGSVATGTARRAVSDIDLLSIGLHRAAELAQLLSRRYADLCRGVEIAAAEPAAFDGDSDEAYGNRVFLRHYCVHLAGPDPAAQLAPFPADVRAARGFNGDIDTHARRWRTQLASETEDVAVVGTRVARKTLLAVAAMVSVHDRTWTTDRSLAARRWGEIDPRLAAGLARLDSWAGRIEHPTRPEVEAVLDESGLVSEVVTRFRELVGLWDDASRHD